MIVTFKKEDSRETIVLNTSDIKAYHTYTTTDPSDNSEKVLITVVASGIRVQIDIQDDKTAKELCGIFQAIVEGRRQANTTIVSNEKVALRFSIGIL